MRACPSLGPWKDAVAAIERCQLGNSKITTRKISCLVPTPCGARRRGLSGLESTEVARQEYQSAEVALDPKEGATAPNRRHESPVARATKGRPASGPAGCQSSPLEVVVTGVKRELLPASLRNMGLCPIRTEPESKGSRHSAKSQVKSQ